VEDSAATGTEISLAITHWLATNIISSSNLLFGPIALLLDRFMQLVQFPFRQIVQDNIRIRQLQTFFPTPLFNYSLGSGHGRS